jgi:anti-anti-sigma factor
LIRVGEAARFALLGPGPRPAGLVAPDFGDPLRSRGVAVDQADVAFRPLWMIGEPGDDSEALRLQVLVSPCPRHRGESDAAVVKIVGELDAYSAALAEPAVRRFVLFADEVVIDLSELHFIDAAGLRLLISLADGGETVRLEDPGPRISHVFEIAGLSHLCDRTVIGVAS